MRRISGLAVAFGAVASVVGLSEVHATAHDYSYASSARFGWSLALVAGLLIAAYGFGLPDLPRTRRNAWACALGAAASGALVVSGLQLVVGAPLLPRVVVLGATAILLPYWVLCAHLAGDARNRAGERDRVALVADLDEAATLRDELERLPERPAMIVVDLDPAEARSADPPARPLVDAVHRSRASVVVLSRAAQGDEEIVMQAALLHESGVRVRTLSMFYEQWLGKLPVSELERVSLLFDIGEVHAPRYARLKRMLDIVVAIGGAVVLALVTPIVVVGNLIANRGPVLYRQPRTGRHGEPFEILKFRTMTAGPSTDPTVDADPRVTPFGRLLRRTHLDELPQVVNILRGELSVVGPRPEQPHLVEQLSAKIPFYRLRHLVRPGLTGWAQVKYHYGSDELDALQKLQYEFFYLRHQGFGLDLRVMARTVRHVLGLEGR
jgi:lipopolysaccharide/colanic/teichoic acid biosynthesis glycosyltransferase